MTDGVIWFMPQWLRDLARETAFTDEDLYEFALMQQQSEEPAND